MRAVIKPVGEEIRLDNSRAIKEMMYVGVVLQIDSLFVQLRGMMHRAGSAGSSDQTEVQVVLSWIKQVG